MPPKARRAHGGRGHASPAFARSRMTIRPKRAYPRLLDVLPRFWQTATLLYGVVLIEKAISYHSVGCIIRDGELKGVPCFRF